ncbi:hypothetical protein SASPL_105459 [Salvia splendens]|uniref:CCHC-type domain-containing protein n=1 Tax=Salvia splendens TaxID=180675 RepID=A0A8X9AAS1_SALSN|nr:hypothetical protein SASPL_105459 [Salvia splendens]
MWCTTFQVSSESEEVPLANVVAPMAGQDDILFTMAIAMQQIARNVPPSQSSIIKQMHEYHAEEFRDVDMCRKFRRGLRSIILAGLVGLETSDLTKLSHAARTLEQLKVTEKVEEGSMNHEKRPVESSHSASRFLGKRFIETTSMASTGRSDRVPMCQYCGRPHHGECRKLLGTCFLCRSKDHYYRECPRGQVSSETRSVPEVQQGRGIGRGFGAARGQRATSEPIQRPTKRTPSRAYAIWTRKDTDAPDVILANLMKLPFCEFDIILGMD